MLRPEYWERSKSLLAFCNDEELNVLAQQAKKELNKRIAAYTDKLDIDESHKKTVSRRKAKERAIKRNMKNNK